MKEGLSINYVTNYVSMKKIKARFKKMHERFTESKWTRNFIITSIIQAIFAIILMSRVLNRNHKAGEAFRLASAELSAKGYPVYSNGTIASQEFLNSCVKFNIDRVENIVGENVIFLIFNIFQLWFCQNAIFNQNTIQIIFIVVINYVCALIAIVQIVEIDKWTSQAEDCLVNYFTYNERVAMYEVPLIIVLVVCATFQVFFTWKLYQQFGWNIYKKIGADLRMQRLYRTMLIFIMLLKVDLFFMNFLAIVACVIVNPNRLNQNINEGLYYFHIVITIIIVFLQILAYRSLRRESSLEMKIFIGAWIMCIADLIIILVDSIKPSSEESWYFFTFFIVLGLIASLVTLLWSIFVLRNFERGLQPHLNRPNNSNTLPMQQPPNITDPSIPTQRVGGTRWAIDD